MRHRASWLLVWVFGAIGWVLAVAYALADLRGGALDLF